ncbi:molybdate ABC transporter permease subunit [Rehaibacterium terrae]|jgi:molybdate transport system permease protein|uniref:Molybdenum transport system permease n=1 Tax=Rehaibacterium terrae TaxID=1341696 RepID=A0A7W8DFI8_9GAMM|nr:molybdate ABC transporter permease subunit [Rehaibacterium terrae]MBB5016426.1 molybdate transport system permease protein [Rehaibacterium terrae]
MLAPQDWQAIGVTLRLCLWTTVILLLLGTPLAWWLAHTRSRFRAAVEALVALPLVLPPTVLGFYLLVALGPRGPVGGLLETLGGTHLAFSFSGILIGSVLYSLPFAVQPLQDGFRAIGRQPLEVAATLGAGPLDRFFTVALPLARGSVLTAATLAFAHTMGEFGVVLMIGGSIPGETQVLSIAIYDAAEALDYRRAHILSALLLALSFVILWLVFARRRRVATVGA